MRKFVICVFLGLLLAGIGMAQVPAPTSGPALSAPARLLEKSKPEVPVTAAISPSNPDSLSRFFPAKDQLLNVTLPAILSWKAIAQATAYQLQIATTPDFQAPVADISNITTLSYPVSELANGTQYFWRVKALGTAEASNWSETKSFTTVAPAVSTDSKSNNFTFSGTGPAPENTLNPATNSIAEVRKNKGSPAMVNFLIPAKGDYTITLHNLAGKPVCILKQGYAPARETLSVDLKSYDLPDGIYMVKVFASKSSQHYLRVKVGD